MIINILISILFFSVANSEDNIPLVPGMYIFGDSIVDGGNIKLEPPYGIDLDPSLPPRATNGLTIADYFAISLGLPLVPPYRDNHNSTTGINYAYGGSGILPEMMPGMPGGGWNFDQQIAYFRTSISDHLARVFKEDEFKNHFQKSIFLISFGINDFIGFIRAKNTYGHPLEPMAFSKYLLRSLSERLTRLYIMGARKFLVTNIWPLGCMPYYNTSSIGFCNKTINDMVIDYSNSLPLMLHELGADLDGFRYSYSDDFTFTQYLTLHPQLTGITKTLDGCWNKDTKTLCTRRDQYLYFDQVHPTKAANSQFASNCFNGTLCAPQNVMGLVGNY